MKESVAVAKEADAKKGVSPTRSDSSIHRVRDEPERQLGSLRGVIGNIRRDGGTPSVDSIATELSGVHATQRAPALLALQQTHGNRYVQRVVSGIQAKLVVGQPGDIYEQEADRVADAVMRMPEPDVQRQVEEEEEKKKEEEKLIQTKPISEQITPLVQRQVDPEEEEEEEEILQTKNVSNHTPEVTPDLESRIPALKGGGQPLPEANREFMERRFGIDFSGVRLHTDSDAAQMSRELNAEAFTYGRDIYFGAGRYNPGTLSGKRLLAHELTHVVQQAGGQTLLQLLRFRNNGVDFNFETLTMTHPCFNSGPGIVRNLDAGSQVEWLRFYSGMNEPCAWRFSPQYEFTYSPNSEASGHHIGFIQTVEDIRYDTRYESLPPVVSHVTNSRDALNSGVPAPWYNQLNQPSGPVDLWSSESSPEIEDMPFNICRVWGQPEQQNLLQSVHATGLFHIWLVVKHQTDPGNQLSRLSFLYNISVSYDRSWRYQGSIPSVDIGFSSSWSGAGGQRIVSQGEGIGSATPVLSGQIAGEQLPGP